MNKKYLRSLLELAVVTFVASLLGLATASDFDPLSLGAWKAAVAASIPPVIAVLYGVVARFKGNFASALAVDTRE